MASPPLLHLQAVGLTFGGVPLLSAADLAVGQGERIALVGRNGSGKSTLLKIAAGLIEADQGTRFIQPGATIRYLPQEPDLSGFATVLSYVEAGLAPGDDPYRAHALLGALGMDPDAAPEHLSGGEVRRAALARLLAPMPDILLLDEPTNHLDLPAIQWLEDELAQMRSAMVIISHDRRFLENLTRTTVWLDRGKSLRLEEGFARFEAWRDQIFEQEEMDAHKLGRQIAREEDWMRYGVTARRKRNMRRVAALQALRDQHKTARKPQGLVKMQATESDQSGTQVIVAERISKQFGERMVVKDLSLRVLRGDRLGIIGPNGAGKTTLINLLTGALAPDQGEVRQGTRLQTVLIDQRRDLLSDEQITVADVLTGGRGDTLDVNDSSRHVVGYLKDFLFLPEQARQPVSALSGGERARLLLAKALAAPSNLLVLDEPTNDLDLETLDLLEDLLSDYAGTVLLVSHDRDCLDRVCSAILMAEDDGRWTLYAGGYSDMLAQRGEGIQARHKPTARVTKRETDTPSSDPARKTVRRLSFKEKHALETLPDQMAALERDSAKLQTALDEPDLFMRDRARFERLMKALEACQTQLAAAEEEWLRLEMLRESLEQSEA